MLDLKFVRENPEIVKENIKNKFQDQKLPLVDEVIALDVENRKAQQEADALRSNRKTLSKQIGALMAQGKREEAEELKNKVNAQATALAELEIKEEKGLLSINISGDKMGLVIGYRGETLDSLQYLTSLVINKNHEDEYIRVSLDTENYRQKREETLIRFAQKIAYKVKKSGRPYKLEPMNPYERRIIHSALQEYNDINTYSEGEEPFRRVVVSIKR